MDALLIGRLIDWFIHSDQIQKEDSSSQGWWWWFFIDDRYTYRSFVHCKNVDIDFWGSWMVGIYYPIVVWFHSPTIFCYFLVSTTTKTKNRDATLEYFYSIIGNSPWASPAVSLQVLASEGRTESNTQVRMRRRYSSKTVESYVPKRLWTMLERVCSFLLKTALYLTEKNRSLGIDSY